MHRLNLKCQVQFKFKELNFASRIISCYPHFITRGQNLRGIENKQLRSMHTFRTYFHSHSLLTCRKRVWTKKRIPLISCKTYNIYHKMKKILQKCRPFQAPCVIWCINEGQFRSGPFSKFQSSLTGAVTIWDTLDSPTICVTYLMQDCKAHDLFNNDESDGKPRVF